MPRTGLKNSCSVERFGKVLYRQVLYRQVSPRWDSGLGFFSGFFFPSLPSFLPSFLSFFSVFRSRGAACFILEFSFWPVLLLGVKSQPYGSVFSTRLVYPAWASLVHCKWQPLQFVCCKAGGRCLFCLSHLFPKAVWEQCQANQTPGMKCCVVDVPAAACAVACEPLAF